MINALSVAAVLMESLLAQVGVLIRLSLAVLGINTTRCAILRVRRAIMGAMRAILRAMCAILRVR